MTYSILPPDKPVKPHIEPHNFFIYGATMAGKSFFSSYFPHPLVLNTDGNASQGTAPSIQIRNQRDANGNLIMSSIDQLNAIINALQQPGVTFKTVIVDVIDDLCTMIDQAICLQGGKETLADFQYGKGYAKANSVLQRLVIDLKALPMDVIYVSRELEITDDTTGITHFEPSLKTKQYNIVNGNCDLVIRMTHNGNDYGRIVKAKRANYKPSDITNSRVKYLLSKCEGMFPDEPKKQKRAEA